MFYFSAPMKGYTSANDRKSEQESKFYSDFIWPLANAFLNEGSSSLEIFMLNPVQIDKAFNEIFINDLVWIALSILLVLLYMMFHLKSVFLGVSAMINIVMSFPLTIVLYKLVFQIKYYGFLQNLAVFVVLGIAADDVFVFTDAWKQSG
jgi:hypothetical protein